MAFPNVTDIVATTMASRSKVLGDSVADNNAVLTRIKQKGGIRPVTGGHIIYEPLMFAENGNAGWYSDYDQLPIEAQDVISAAQFSLKQLAVAVTVSGLEELENAGKEKMIDLLNGRMKVAEATMLNYLSQGLYADGTGSGGKILVGLAAAVPTAPTTGTYGGIDRSDSANVFWRPQLVDNTTTSATIQTYMNQLWVACVRGNDKPDLITAGNTQFLQFMASLQTLQRFSDPKLADLGFQTLKFMNADVVLDGGIGGNETATNMRFLNTNYLHWRPHKDRDLVPLPRRFSTNQDASVVFLGWAGAFTCSGAQFQGLLEGS